ncbi:MAG: hypothetical protein GOU97_02915 [Nanoarchaeota archaeon]|nr:hypothetical protein [Nanoarchaeota archaeon]
MDNDFLADPKILEGKPDSIETFLEVVKALKNKKIPENQKTVESFIEKHGSSITPNPEFTYGQLVEAVNNNFTYILDCPSCFLGRKLE